MSYNLILSNNQSYEVLLSFSLYIRQTHLKYLHLGSNWINKVSEMLSEDFKNKISKLNDLSFFDLSMVLIEASPSQDFKNYINWLKSLSGGDIYEILAPSIKENNLLPSNLSEKRNEYIKFLSSWYIEYFISIVDDLSQLHSFHFKRAKELQLIIKNEELVETLTEGIVIETKLVKNVFLIPSFHFRPFSIVDTIGENLFIMFPMNDEINTKNNLLTFGKTLGDKSRLDILSFLNTGKYSFTEVVKHFNMAKGNIHHHLLILRATGFLNIHITDDNNNFHYSTRKNIKEKIQKNLSVFLDSK